jgi:hypothetical protein
MTVHDSPDASAEGPLKIGGRAQEPTTQPDEVADNDRVDALFDRAGRLAVYGGYPFGSAAIAASSSGDNTIVAAQAAGKRIAVWQYVIIAEGDVDVRWESGAGGTALSGQMHLTADGQGIQATAGGLVPLFNMLSGEVIFGGVGAGLYGILMFAVLAVFIAGLMVGRTPEYLGKKIEKFEVQMAMLATLVLAASVATVCIASIRSTPDSCREAN